MEANVIPYGDAAAVKKALAEIGADTLLGKNPGAGRGRHGKSSGGQENPGGEGASHGRLRTPGHKGARVTFATSTMGADHTAGFTIREGLDSHERRGRWEASGRMQVKRDDR